MTFLVKLHKNILSSEIQKNISIIYIFYLLTLTVLTIFYSKALLHIHPFYMDENFNMNFNRLGRENDLIIKNLFEHNEFKLNYLGIDFYSAKYPLLPYTIYYLASISKNFYFILISKNIIFYSILFWTAYFYTVANLDKYQIHYFFLIIFLLHFNPYNFHVMSNFYFEDFANSILLPSLFLVLITKSKRIVKFISIGLIVSLLFLSKASFTIFGYLFPLIFIFLNKKNLNSFIPLFIFLIASIIWSTYSYKKTGFYPFLNSNSSFNHRELAIPLQENFHKIYPFYTVDAIHNTKNIFNNKEKYGFQNLKNEWEFNELFKTRNLEYLSKNFLRYFKDSFIKLNFIFFYPYQDANTPSTNIDNKEIKYSMIINRIFLLSAVIIGLNNLIKNLKNKNEFKHELYYFLILILIIPIFIIGWATSKHLVGICNLSIIYLINYFLEKKNLK